MRKSRIILDTNVLIGAMVAELAPGHATPDQKLDKLTYDFSRQHYDLCFSQKTMEEFAMVAVDMNGKTRNLGPTTVFNRTNYVGRLQSQLEPWKPGVSALRCEDPKDQMFLDLARGVRADFIVSRDRDILQLKQEGSCLFLSPEEFANTFIAKSLYQKEVLAMMDATPRNSRGEKVSIGPKNFRKLIEKRVAGMARQSEQHRRGPHSGSQSASQSPSRSAEKNKHGQPRR